LQNAGEGSDHGQQENEPRADWRLWLIRYLQAKISESKTQKEQETASDGFARRTANATVCLAILTFVLASATILTYIEVRGGGKDTHDLAVAAGKQADAAKTLAEQAKAQTAKMSESIEKATEQAAATNKLAREAHRSANIAAQVFDVSNRPYVGIETIRPIYIASSGAQQPMATRRTAKRMDVIVVIKNFGLVAGTEFTARWKVWINGKDSTTPGITDRPSTIFPSGIVTLNGHLGENNYPTVAAGTELLEFDITIQYAGPSGTYKECYKNQYSPDDAAFINLGPLCTAN